ncbi:TIM-barrel domain-containing protein [Bifidobacterium simiarum]|nr:TIM-barrel domain-containing protein [Bifidobacterium simiarum]
MTDGEEVIGMVLSTFSVEGNSLLWTGKGEYLRIDPCGPDGVRVRSSRTPIDVEDPNDSNGNRHSSLSALLPGFVAEPQRATVSIDETAHTATLVNGGITVRAEVEMYTYSCRLSFFDTGGELLFAEQSRGGALQRRSRHLRPRLGGDFSAEVTFEADPEERLYGMGEYQQNILNLKGCELELAHRNSQASIPFVVSSKGYGFLWNNPAIGSVAFARNHTRWSAESTKAIDYWVTAGDSYADIMRRYADATGHAPNMPEWGLGFWQCKLRYWNQRQLLETAREFKRRNIPIDVIVIDFFHWPHMGDFRFEDEFWPDPKAMCDELHDMGIKLMVSVWPQIGLDSENHAEMNARNLLVASERGQNIGMMFEGPSQFYDATNPEARDYVWDKCRANYADKGVDAFWLDEDEPEFAPYDFDGFRYQAGPVLQAGNIYPREHCRGFYEHMVAEGREGDIVNLTRCAWAGTQRYGALVWSGDVHPTFADFARQITCGIHLGMAGIPWFTTDMGGFLDGDINSPAYRELLARWCAFSCFSPVMRNHGDRSDHEAPGRNEYGKEDVRAADGSHRCHSGADNEPWSYGEDMERIFRKYIAIRESLRPYLRELFDEAHESGQPLMRGLFYEFPDDGRAGDIADEYLLGPDLLVAPVTTAGATEREVYLPGGPDVGWTDVRTGETHAGGSTVSVPAPIDEIPVFARDGRDHGLNGRM